MKDTLFPVPVKLPARQQFVYDLTEHGPVDAVTAGSALHLKHKRRCGCGPERACEWADANGREVLEALRKRGLLRRNVHWIYRRTDDGANSQGDLPKDF